MCRHTSFAFIAAVVLLATRHASWGQSTDKVARVPPAPVLDPQAIAVARLDVAKIDPHALEKTLREYIDKLPLEEFAESVIDRNVRHFAARVRQLRDLGVERIELVLTLHDVQMHYERLAKEPESFIYAMMPVPQGMDPMALSRVLVEDPPGSGKPEIWKHSSGPPRLWRGGPAKESSWFSLNFHSAMHVNDAVNGNVILAGPPNVLDYLVTARRGVRPAVTAALAAAGDGPFQLALIPPAVFSRAAKEILGPVKLDGLSVGDTLAEGFQWAALGIETAKGSLEARIVIQSRTAAGTKQMDRLIQVALTAAAKQPKAKDGHLAKLAKLIDFEASADQLVWQMGDGHTPPAKVADALSQVLLTQQVRIGERQSIDNMKHIVLSLHNFHDVYRAFPTPATYDQQGKPLLSWRVHVLPYVEEGALYREFRRDEPWDSPHNRKLIDRMPAVYRRPLAPANSVKSPYLMPIDEKTTFQPGTKTTLHDVRDGTAKTIGIVEVDPEHEVIWTKPDDWEVDWADPTKGLTGGSGASFIAGFLDGAVRPILKSVDKELLRALLTGAGGEPIGQISKQVE
jgi:hypothetical protein